ncbi:MAG: hypothetical protein ACFCGT_13285, partial [Sandaracinaceae bacterium]
SPRPARPILVPAPSPDPAAGIPIFRRDRYRYYLSVSQLLERFTLNDRFTLGFDRWRFDLSSETWSNDGTFSAEMVWSPAPPGFPSSADYLEGEVRAANGAVVGRLTMGWISTYLRKATIEIDRVSQAEAPLDNGDGVDWRDVGERIGWDLTVDESDANVPEPSGQSWSNAECHASMLARRAASDHDAEWRYHVLCVRRLDATSRGIMYDAYSGDSNNIPREGCAVASHWMIPDTAQWGRVRRQRFGAAAAPYYRTAVHEAGHAMGLYHNTVNNGFMNTTGVIAASGTPATPFPDNVVWAFAPDDEKRLKHMPDVYVRPGGTPFGTSYSATPISPTDSVVEMDAATLEVVPLLPSVPLGAPVRVKVRLAPVGDSPVEVPSDISLASGHVRGEVIDAAGTHRTFTPVVLCSDHAPLAMLSEAKGEEVHDCMTLLRGRQGALFPMPGPYTIRVEAHWEVGGVEMAVSGSARVDVTPAVDAAHAEAASRVLSTPDTLLTLVLGGDHLKEGMEAIDVALANPVLKPHFAYIEAKRLARPFRKRKADLGKAAKLIDKDTVMSPAELRRAAAFTAAARNGGTKAATSLATTLKAKAKARDVDDATRSVVEAL